MSYTYLLESGEEAAKESVVVISFKGLKDE